MYLIGTNNQNMSNARQRIEFQLKTQLAVNSGSVHISLSCIANCCLYENRLSGAGGMLDYEVTCRMWKLTAYSRCARCTLTMKGSDGWKMKATSRRALFALPGNKPPWTRNFSNPESRAWNLGVKTMEKCDYMYIVQHHIYSKSVRTSFTHIITN